MEKQAPGNEKPRVVLIVDDDSAHCDNLEDILSEEGITVCSVGTYTEALKAADEIKPHVALLDIQLPDGSGTGLLSWLKKKHPDCISLMITAYADLDSAVAALDQGAFHYLQKPFSPEELLRLIKRAFEFINFREEKREIEETLKVRNIELEEVNRRLRRIVGSIKKFASCSNLEQIGPLLLEAFAANMEAGGGSLYLREGDGLVLVHSLDPEHTPATIAFPLKKNSAFEKVLGEGQPILINDIKKENNVFSSGWKGYKNPSSLIFPLPDESGKIVGIISLHNKITPPFIPQDLELGSIIASYSSETIRATQAVEAMRESEKKFRTVLDANPDPVIVFNIKGEVIYLNPVFTRVFGWNMEELQGKEIVDIFIPDEAQPETKIIMKKLLNGKIFSGIETIRYTKDCRIIPVSVSGSIYRDQDGNGLGVVINIRDITKQKNLEAQLIQAQKMEAIGTLAGGIAHDFNNILSAIVGYAEMAQFDVSKESPATNKIEQILTASGRAKDLVRQILAFSRHNPQEQKPVQLKHIVKEAVKLLRASLPSTIEIRMEIKRKSSTVLADPTQIHQVLMNLCTNAHHAMGEKGGLLEVVLDTVEIDAGVEAKYRDLKAGSYVELSVADSGCGIDPLYLERIFDPYFTTKEKDEGTGLGLAVVHGIAKNYGGAIKVESESGKGTTFKVYLPRIEDQIEIDVKPSKSLSPGNERILFVDDEEILVDIGKQMLDRLGYSVVTKTSSADALEAFRKQPDQFDLVITDMTMPKMTGEVLAKELLTIRADIPVVICTGYSERSIKDKADVIGVRDILIKPLAIHDLSDCIRKVLG